MLLLLFSSVNVYLLKMIVHDRVFVALLTMVRTVYKNDTAKEYDANTFVE